MFQRIFCCAVFAVLSLASCSNGPAPAEQLAIVAAHKTPPAADLVRFFDGELEKIHVHYGGIGRRNLATGLIDGYRLAVKQGYEGSLKEFTGAYTPGLEKFAREFSYAESLTLFARFLTRKQDR